jgi:hypothetical protein
MCEFDNPQFKLVSPTHKRAEGRAPVWGSEFTSKAAALQRDPAETAATLNVKLWVLVVVTDWWYLIPHLAQSHFYTEIKSRREAGRFAGHSRVSVCASVLRTLPPAAPPASPVAPARSMIGRVLYTAASFLFKHTRWIPNQLTKRRCGQIFRSGWSGQNTHKKKRNTYERTVVKADASTATVTKGNEQYSAPWVVESPGGTVTTSAYNDGKKRCLSAEGGSGNPRKKASEQNKPSRGLIAKAAIVSAKTRSARKPTSAKRRCAVRPVRRK